MAITPLWCAGMESRSLKEFTSTGNPSYVSISSVQAYTGTYSLLIKATRANENALYNFDAISQGQVGFFIRPQQGYVNNYYPDYMCLWEGDSDWLVITRVIALKGYYGASNVGLYVNGSLQASPVPYTASAWQHWAIDYKIDASAGWVKFYINGVLSIDYTGNTGTASPNGLQFGSTGASASYVADTYFDDMYLTSTVGESAATVPAVKRFIWGTPVADGTKAWTPSTGTDHYALVDETPYSETDYIEAGAANLVDTFTHSLGGIPLGYSINAIWPVSFVSKSEGGIPSTLKLHQTDGVDSEDAAEATLSAVATASVTARFATRPNGESWNLSSAENVEFGVKSSGSFAV